MIEHGSSAALRGWFVPHDGQTQLNSQPERPQDKI
jgi:hypothetical protein